MSFIKAVTEKRKIHKEYKFSIAYGINTYLNDPVLQSNTVERRQNKKAHFITVVYPIEIVSFSCTAISPYIAKGHTGNTE